MAILGIVRAYLQANAGSVRPHLITSKIEHHAVLHAMEVAAQEYGCEVTYVEVDATGAVSIEAIRAAIRPETVLISVMWGNNEVGTLQPIAEIGALAREAGIVFHVDAVQALGHVQIVLRELPIDLASFSAHKINGPQGVGALYVRQGVRIAPLLVGGAQEKRRRAGTENVAGIVGFAAALRLHTAPKEGELRAFFIEGLKQALEGYTYTINTPVTNALPHILNVSFPGIQTETMLMNLDLAGVAAASGSACSSGSLEVSHVLKAMQLSDEQLNSAIRFSFGLGNHEENVTFVLQKLKSIVNRLNPRL
jgi:cysteine desulfurase